MASATATPRLRKSISPTTTPAVAPGERKFKPIEFPLPMSITVMVPKISNQIRQHDEEVMIVLMVMWSPCRSGDVESSR